MIDKYIVILFATLFFMVSCKNKRAEKGENYDTVKTVLMDEPDHSGTDDLDNTYGTDSTCVFDMILPEPYRMVEGVEFPDDIVKGWKELYYKDGSFYMGEVTYTIEEGYDDCAEIATKRIKSNKDAFLFFNNNTFKSSKIDTVLLSTPYIWPGKKYAFNFKGKKYILRGEGKILSPEVNDTSGEDLFYEVSDYKLYLSTDNAKEQLIYTQKYFDNTFVEILVVGDIDKDGKPDIILDAPRNYEERRVLLLLSSYADEGDLLKVVSLAVRNFDC